MRLQRLELDNFLRFRGCQSLDFPKRDGVIVIYGENNHGKTTILNAMRWLFLNEFANPDGTPRAPRKLVNKEVLAESNGKASASVRARVTTDDTDFSLARTVSVDGEHAEISIHVSRGSDTLSVEEGEAVLARLMPKQVHQFFLFDAEDLRRYEDLVRDTDAGDTLKNAIERILGVPILKNARTDLAPVKRELTRRIASVEADNKKAEEATTALGHVQEQLAQLVGEREALDGNIETLVRELGLLEGRMQKSSRVRSLLRARDAKRAELRHAQDELRSAREDLSEATASAWRALITEATVSKTRDLEAELETVMADRRIAERETMLAQLAAELSDTGTCPVCSTSVSEFVAPSAPTPSIDEELEERVTDLRTSIRELKAVQDPAAGALLKERERRFRSLDVRVADLSQELQEFDEELEGEDEEEIEDLARTYSNVRQHLSNERARLRKVREDIDQSEDRAKKLRGVIEETAGAEAKHLLARVRQIDALESLFMDAIAQYRDSLSRRVETEATKMFLRLRSEEQFVGLKINDRYGLSIVHQDQSAEEFRSAGLEHLVAVSLITALQKCAPVKGPVFMDMPFARLDERHFANMIKNLPSIAGQVILLTHSRELDHDRAAEHLGDKLLVERLLVRGSSSRQTYLQTFSEVAG